MAREAGILEALLAGRSFGTRSGSGLGDDALVLATGASEGARLCLTTDSLEEGLHFRREWQTWEELGRRLLAVNLSDLAAMGAEPFGCLLSVSWPEDLAADIALRFGAGLLEAERLHACPLLGGDTDVGGPCLRLNLVVLGLCRAPAPLLRSGARAGDALFVSGPLGGAAAVVKRFLAGEPVDESDPAWADALRRFRLPEPRLALGQALAGRAHALIDISDGLRPDLERLGAASGLASRLERELIPLHRVAAASCDGLDLALEGGEDYELLVAGPEDLPAAFPSLTRIGRLETGPPGHVEIAR